jgi:hypothetical protein
MSNRRVIALLLVAALALPAVSMSADQPITKTAMTEVKATVVAVDQATRLVTLKDSDGKTFDVEAGPEVKHLDQVASGDVVAVTYAESLAFEVVGKDERPEGATESVKRSTGAGEVGRTVTSHFKINAYDRNTHVLWGTGPKGNTQSIVVKDPKAQKKLETLSPGNIVQVTYTESLAVKLEKVAK